MKNWKVLAYILVMFLFCLNLRAETIESTSPAFEYISAEEVSLSSICTSPPCFIDGLRVTLKFELPCNNPALHYDYKLIDAEVPKLVISALVSKEEGLTCNRYTYTKKYIDLIGEHEVEIEFIGDDN